MQYKSFTFFLVATTAVAQQSLDNYLEDSGFNDYMSSLDSLATQTNLADYTAALPTGFTLPTDLPSITYHAPPPSIAAVLATAVPANYISSLTNPAAQSALFHSISEGDFPQWYKDLPQSVKAYLSTAYAVATGDATATADVTATGGAAATTADSASSSSSASASAGSSTSEGVAAPTGAVAVGLMGAAGILGLAIAL
ncbi:hypothetical protein FE257_000354 [Aspergillus nanangensis]|uniref:Uncharacterized protein n=1 Tax=Aspergillus nanangensis TaxID=2582783 RepID=A0AAD4CZL6_ASPNN|nr:hypothetical protein FE257_000354 [Aspergillus nanangensis]